MSKQDPSQYLLTPEEIDALRPPDDGYSYYRSYGEAVQNALLQKLADKVWVKVPIIPEHTGEDGIILEGGYKYSLLSEVLRVDNTCDLCGKPSINGDTNIFY